MVAYHKVQSWVNYGLLFSLIPYSKSGLVGSSALEIIPRFSPSLMPLVVNEISDCASERGMELNYKKCKQMLINFLKYTEDLMMKTRSMLQVNRWKLCPLSSS